MSVPLLLTFSPTIFVCVVRNIKFLGLGKTWDISLPKEILLKAETEVFKTHKSGTVPVTSR
jgi:hypothetical protein